MAAVILVNHDRGSRGLKYQTESITLPLRNFCANARIEQVSAKSSSRTSTCALGCAARILAAASSPFSTSLHAMITLAPER